MTCDLGNLAPNSPTVMPFLDLAYEPLSILGPVGYEIVTSATVFSDSPENQNDNLAQVLTAFQL